MAKTAHEIRLGKLRDWERQEMANRHEAKKAWILCGISFGVGLLLYPVLCKIGWEIGALLVAVCGHIFFFNIWRILQCEKEEERRRAEMDLLTELEQRDV